MTVLTLPPCTSAVTRSLVSAARWLPAAMVGMLLTSGCGGDSTGPGPGPGPGGGAPTQLEIVPGAVLFTTSGESRQLAVRALDADGNEVTAPAVTWQSSNSSMASITATGVVTAAANLGSAQITAQGGGLTSAPMLVLVAQPAAGALLVADSQVVSITPVDANAPFDLGWQYVVRLRGVSPTVGQLVLASGGATVGGRVVSVAPAGSAVDATLEVVALPDLFQQLLIDESISLANVPLEPAPRVVRHLQPRLQRGISGSVQARFSSTSLVDQSFDLGPFGCKVTEGVGISASLFSLNNVTFNVSPSLSLDFQYDSRLGGLQRLVLTGGLDGQILADPRITASLSGGVECSVEIATLILPIGGALSAVIAPAVPLGVSFATKGSVNLGGFGFDLSVQAHADASAGVDCTAGCTPVLTATSQADGSFKPALPTPLDSGFRANVAITGSGFAKLALVNPFIKSLRFEAFKFEGGLSQSVDLASLQAQVADPLYASGFQLKPFVKAGTGSSVELLGKLLKVDILTASFEPKFAPLATSPKGSIAIAPASVQAGDGTQPGDQATFTVTLDTINFLGVYAVNGVEIRRKAPDGAGGFTVQLSPPGCTELPATSGQKVFTCQTAFLAADTGQQTFYAFAKANLFGIPMPVAFEIALDAKAVLQVNPPGVAVHVSPTSARLLPGATQQFTATVSGTSDQAVTWSATGGSITAAGLYTAGNAPGTFSVRATSVADPTAFQDATVSISIGALTGNWSGQLDNFCGTSFVFIPFTASVTGDTTAISGTWDLAAGGCASNSGVHGTFAATMDLSQQRVLTFVMNAEGCTADPSTTQLSATTGTFSVFDAQNGQFQLLLDDDANHDGVADGNFQGGFFCGSQFQFRPLHIGFTGPTP